MSLTYLASPYSHPDADLRLQRFDAACSTAAALYQKGRTVYSPIVNGHPLVRYGLPTHWGFWSKHDRIFLNACSELVVLSIPGWEESRGVQCEIEIARSLGKPVRIWNPFNAPPPSPEKG